MALTGVERDVLQPNRRGGGIFYVLQHANLKIWHICDRRYTDSENRVLALHCEYIMPVRVLYRLSHLQKEQGIICERCMKEFQIALPRLRELNLIKD